MEPNAQTSHVLDLLIAPVERVGILARARRHLRHGVVVISATAGYGKTTLLHLLTQEVPNSLWLPLTLADRDVVFLQERLGDLREGHVLLLDDVHLLDGADETLAWLANAVQGRPWGWAISGRWIPEPLRRVLHALPTLYITEKDLAFTLDEVKTWLEPLGYDEKTLTAWHTLTHGWPLAIAALVRLATQYVVPTSIDVDLEEFLEAVVFDRLWQELSPPVRLFLTLTGVALECSSEVAEFLWAEFAPDAFPPVQDVWQEVVHRRLFVEPGVHPDTWRYHDLFRQFLRRRAEDRPRVARALVRWYSEHSRYEEAIEQALADELWAEAADLLLNHTRELIYHGNRIETYRRWVLSLPHPVLEAHPLLLVQLGAWLCAFKGRKEGLAWVEEGMALVQARNDVDLLRRAYRFLSKAFRNTEDVETALLYARRLLEIAGSDEDRRDAYQLLADVYLTMGNLVLARRFYREALHSLNPEEAPFHAVHLWESLAAGVLAPMGHIDRAEELLRKSLPLVRDLPALYHIHLQEWASLYIEIGDWPRAREKLEEMETALRECDDASILVDIWRHALWAMYYVGVENWKAAAASLKRLESLGSYEHTKQFLVAYVRVWQARRRGEPETAMRLAEKSLQEAMPYPLSRGVLALERDIAATEALDAPPPLHPDTYFLVQQRALPALLRLRGLLAWRCYRQGEIAQARRHLRRILALLRRFPRLKPVLETRDPELARRVWRTAILLGEGEEMAVDALAAQEDLAVPVDLLARDDPRVQCLAARTLAATRREEAMLPLQEALGRHLPSSVRACVRQALESLEALPPPILEVRFLGAFRVFRGGKEIPESAWPRPAVVRLFQYLVLHRGHPLTRDRILDDLWPGQDPNQVRNTLRRLLSWLRQVLEPYMPPKGPFRYLEITWDTYIFDPQDRVRVDVEAFVRTVGEVLNAPEEEGVPALPDAFIAALEAWATPVSVAPYEDWWLEHVREWKDLYVQGCVHAARAYLVRRAYQSAVEWADRALAEAPWLERAYQVKMRALARQGCRARALAVYEEARAALRRELGVEPSPQMEWLAERLRRGEEI